MRQSYSAALKKKIALEAIREEKTLGQIASAYNVHPVQVSKWKKQLLDGAEEIFRDKRKSSKDEKETTASREAFERKIGQLAMENDFLKKKLEM